jgi:hypothetical protein
VPGALHEEAAEAKPSFERDVLRALDPIRPNAVALGVLATISIDSTLSADAASVWFTSSMTLFTKRTL